ncbi:hypothetical protein SteCoe_2243 [Stentor coeruleus]|uniref:Uncharacterized protein n=1 Tax=Stentor coeruleus TaxID=5963 RepID=A0A1R2D011_9CILI|nr:hypothetical protein SteCoe_2243 [Stentor coeruleus]
MLAENTINKRKFSPCCRTAERTMGLVPNSFTKIRIPKDAFNSSYSKPGKKLLANRSLGKKGTIGNTNPTRNQNVFPPYSVKFTKPTTPATYSFQLLDSGKLMFSNNKFNGRPISVGGKNIRPAFLEPETTGIHFPNKSAIISPSMYMKEIEEPYKFPDFKFRGNLARFSQI